MLKKNDIIELEITALTNEGNGVGRYEGIAVFVPFTAVGDVISCRIVKVRKSYCYGIINEVITASTDRCDSGCGIFGRCGGCCFRHISYAAELRAKQQIVKDAFERIGGLHPEFHEILGAELPDRYRNKAQFPVSADESGRLYAGFYARRSHRAIEAADCPLLPEVFCSICADILDFANARGVTAYDEETGEGLLRHVYIRRGFHTGEIMAALIVTSDECVELFRPLAKALAEKYPDIRSVLLNVNSRRTNAILGDRVIPLFGSDRIHDTMCGRRIAISLHSFYQINTAQAERVYRLAAELASLGGDETLLDLYCGAGTIGLSMADRVGKLIGVEIIPQAVENAGENAAANGIGNSEFICADAGKAAEMLYRRGELPDVIIADPARKGCTPDTLEYMAKMSPSRIVMISCNPATAARDCAELEKLGYRTQSVTAADFFPRTEHCECVVILTKN